LANKGRKGSCVRLRSTYSLDLEKYLGLTLQKDSPVIKITDADYADDLALQMKIHKSFYKTLSK